MKKYITDFTVNSNIVLNSKHHVLELKSATPLPEMVPGQFVEVKVDGSESTYLRRPFSIHRVNYIENTMHLLIKVVGPGTGKLASSKAGRYNQYYVPPWKRVQPDR
jgi:dihydroorotate dehydrogenase electron transfer subunit